MQVLLLVAEHDAPCSLASASCRQSTVTLLGRLTPRGKTSIGDDGSWLGIDDRRSAHRKHCAYAVLSRCLEIFLFKPQKAHRQLPQVIPVVTNR